MKNTLAADTIPSAARRSRTGEHVAIPRTCIDAYENEYRIHVRVRAIPNYQRIIGYGAGWSAERRNDIFICVIIEHRPSYVREQYDGGDCGVVILSRYITGVWANFIIRHGNNEQPGRAQPRRKKIPDRCSFAIALQRPEAVNGKRRCVVSIRIVSRMLHI